MTEQINIIPPAEQPPEETEKARINLLQETGRQLVNNLFVLLQTARLYDAKNEAFRRPIESFRTGVEKLLAQGEEVSIHFVEQQVYINDIRLKMDMVAFEHLKELFSEFEKRKTGGVRILSQPSHEAIANFAKIFGRTWESKEGMLYKGTVRERIEKALVEADVSSILLLKMVEISEEGEEEDVDILMSNAVSTYGGGVVAMKDILSGKSVATNIIRLSRCVQNLIDLEEKMGNNILALTSIKGCGNYLLSHSMNTCIFAICLGRRLKLNKEMLLDLGLGALTHDIGKSSVSFSLAQLRDEQSPEYQSHPLNSLRFYLKQGVCNESIVRRACIALDHHIQFDGKGGFPKQRIGRNPGVLSRIVGVADFYDVYTTSIEGVREAMLYDVVLRKLLKQGGATFDPVVAKMFIDMLGKFPIGSVVEMDTGDIGIVVKSGKAEKRMLRPLVMLIRDSYGKPIPQRPIIDLAERHERRKAYKYTIVRTHDPAKLKINVSAYLLKHREAEQASAA